MDSPIYISGPMTGYDNHNKESFARAAEWLRSSGFEVLSPHEVKLPERPLPTWEDYMKADLLLLIRARTVVTLPGWECSRGAKLEVEIAHTLGLLVLPISGLQGKLPPV